MASWVMVANASQISNNSQHHSFQTQHASSSHLDSASHFHPYDTALKLSKHFRSITSKHGSKANFRSDVRVGTMSLSSRPTSRPKSRTGAGASQTGRTPNFHQYPTFHPQPSQTSTTYRPTSPYDPSPSDRDLSDVTDDTINTSDITISTDAYDDADEDAEGYVTGEEHHHQVPHSTTHDSFHNHRQNTNNPPHSNYPQLAVPPGYDDMQHPSQGGSPARARANGHANHYVKDGEQIDARVTRQRDFVAHDVTPQHERVAYDEGQPEKRHTPHAARSAHDHRASASGIYSMDDTEFGSLFHWTASKRIGNGNWGQVYAVRPADPEAGIGYASAISSGFAGGGKVAVKLVHRETNPAAGHCIRALWGEMKIIRSLRHEQHPSVISFEAFLICPSVAAVVMPLHKGTMPIPLQLGRALHYFRQLSSAVAYLHSRGITHNDIKPANVVISYVDIPVLVDFGFAQHHKVNDAKRFLSTSSWGTPEYLDPLRVMGQPHDERKSDVWSLGVTMYESLVGRTPFEKHTDEVFETQEQLDEYLERSRSGQWYGEYNIGDPYLQCLLQHMLYPDPVYRLPATEVYNTLSNIISHLEMSASSLATPSFARSRTGVPDDYYDEDAAAAERARERAAIEARLLDEARRDRRRHTLETLETPPSQRKLKAVQSEVIRRERPLTESRKQTSSAQALRPAKQLRPRTPADSAGQENVFYNNTPNSARDTPGGASKLRPRHQGEKGQPRVTSSEYRGLLRRQTDAGTYKATPSRRSSLNVNPNATPARRAPSPAGNTPSPKTREEALAATMRSLTTGARGSTSPSNILDRAHLERPPRPSTAAGDYAYTSPRRGFEDSPSARPTSRQLRRVADGQTPSPHSHHRPTSAGRPALPDVAEDREVVVPVRPTTPATPTPKINIQPRAPHLDVDISTSSVFSATSFGARPTMAGEGLVSKYRGGGKSPQRGGTPISPPRKAKQSTAPSAILGPADNTVRDLERLAEWAKKVELYVEQAKKAVAEGRAVPAMPGIPDEVLGMDDEARESKRESRLGISPESQMTVPSMSSRSSATTSTMLQTPQLAPSSFPQQEKKSSSLSKATGLRRHPVSQVFKRWGERTGASVQSPEPKIAVRKSEPQLDRRPAVATISQAHYVRAEDEVEVLETDDPAAPQEQEPERTPSRMGKTASTRSLRDAVRSATGLLGEKGEKSKTFPRRFGASPVTHDLGGSGEGGGDGEKEIKAKRRMSLLKFFKKKV